MVLKLLLSVISIQSAEGDDMRFWKTQLGILIALLGITGLIWAQAETGQITGTVTDPTGAIVANATVKVVSTSTGAERTTTSSGSGDYAVANLLPGEYTVTVSSEGFTTFQQKVIVAVGTKVGLDVKLQVGQTGTVVQVTESAVKVNTETQTLSTVVDTQQLVELPTLTRNPYALVAISGNVSDAGAGGRGVMGFAINGQRQASTNVLLDGAANNDEFTASVGQAVPLDSVQEFSILTNNFTAEFGRASGGVVNLVTKSGSNDFHGTAYEFNRVSDLAANSFDNNAHGLPKNVFTRNQFGYSFGGPIKKDKLFFFTSTEWIRIRSVLTSTALVPTPQLLAASAPNTQAFFSAFGALKPSATTLQTLSVNQFAAQGVDICGTSARCLAFNPNTPLFSQIAYNVAGDAGGGLPDNEYQTVARVDYNYSDRTQMYFRYALQSVVNPPGTVSSSAYVGFDSANTNFNNNALLSVIHTFSPSFVSQSKAVFNRLNQQQPFGAQPAVPTLYTNPTGATTLLGSNILFPGYDPSTPGSGIPFGGPQNFVQLYQDLSWTHGKHEFRFGGSFDYERDNRTFGAYETAGEYLSSGSLGTAVSNFLTGQLYRQQVAIYPQGQFPGGTVTLPVGPPNFSRSNRYDEGAVYAQDSWKIKPRFTLNIGVRWEHFGVQHNKNPKLDSNFFDPANQIDTPLGIRDGQIFLSPNSPIGGGLWRPDYHDFAPRLGFAWDLTGDGRTSLRAGYGIGYERNFGNVTFNMIQNPPNYETVQINQSQFGFVPITTNNFGILGTGPGTFPLPPASIRNVDPNIRTAYAHTWDVSLEHQLTKNLLIGADYAGSRGVHLYDIQVLNRFGYGNVFLGDPCSFAAGDCISTLNTQYTGINRRGDKGFSNYNALNLKAVARNFSNIGLTFTANYTWSHAMDNLSSTFSDADSFSNNNGQFLVGYLDPYAPQLDKGNSDFDIRHRVSFSAVWDVPFFKGKGLFNAILGGWTIAPLFTARTGSPYSIFDCSNAFNFCTRGGFTAPIPVNGVSNPASVGVNTFNYLPLPAGSIDHYVNPTFLYSDLPPFPADISGRNTFRAPGVWDMDLGVYKSFALTERFKLQLRGEAYDLFNHSNLYVIGTSADDSSTSFIPACRGGCNGVINDRRNIQLALKLIF